MTTLTRTASCSCGQLTVQTPRDPVRVTVCHCLACQRRTGSVFGAQARFTAHSVQIRGTSNVFVRIGDSGAKITYHFCPTCGATVHYALEGEPQLVAIPVGAFADPAFPPPARSLYEQRMHSWVGLPSTIEHLG
jgi:hypothetical protein